MRKVLIIVILSCLFLFCASFFCLSIPFLMSGLEVTAGQLADTWADVSVTRTLCNTISVSTVCGFIALMAAMLFVLPYNIYAISKK